MESSLSACCRLFMQCGALCCHVWVVERFRRERP
jgi:hypothetical protein